MAYFSVYECLIILMVSEYRSLTLYTDNKAVKMLDVRLSGSVEISGYCGAHLCSSALIVKITSLAECIALCGEPEQAAVCVSNS